MKCFYCEQDFNLNLPGDPPRCPKCAQFMQQGIICIGLIDDQLHRNSNHWCVVTTEFIRDSFKPEMANQIIQRRSVFIDDKTWLMLGLPRAGRSGANRKIRDIGEALRN